jgi:hypothetical protein
MKLTPEVLKQIIKEEYMRGVPEFMVREVVEDCTSKLDSHIKRYIQMNAQDSKRTSELHSQANDMLEELKTELFNLISSHIYSFMQNS